MHSGQLTSVPGWTLRFFLDGRVGLRHAFWPINIGAGLDAEIFSRRPCGASASSARMDFISWAMEFTPSRYPPAVQLIPPGLPKDL